MLTLHFLDLLIFVIHYYSLSMLLKYKTSKFICYFCNILVDIHLDTFQEFKWLTWMDQMFRYNAILTL